MEANERDVVGLAATVNVALSQCDFPCRAAVDERGEISMFASRSIAAGERVLIERPLAITVEHDARPFVCATCFADARVWKPQANHGMPSRWTIRCRGCGVLRFCSKECEALLAPRHGGCECDALASIARDEKAAQSPVVDANGTNMLAQAIRILSDRHARTAVESFAGLSVSYDSLNTRLLGVEREWPPAALIDEAAEVALRSLRPEARVPPPELFGLLHRQQCNVYGVCSRGGRDVARACFVGAMHLFNHSCAPNLVFDSVPVDEAAVPIRADRHSPEEAACTAAAPNAAEPIPRMRPDPTPALSLVSLFDIAAGSELAISYLSVDYEPHERQPHLVEHYGFECACPRCTVDETLGYGHAALRCTLADCGTGYGVTVPEQAERRCVHCGRCSLAREEL